MCLAIPGQVVRWIEREPPFCEAEVDFLGVRRCCNLSCVPDAVEGDFVVVHAGVAICLIDPQVARQTLRDITQEDRLDAFRGDP